MTGMTRTSAWSIVDRRIAGRLRVESVADAVVAVPRPVRRKGGFCLHRQDQRRHIRGSLDKGAARRIMLRCSRHLIRPLTKRWGSGTVSLKHNCYQASSAALRRISPDKSDTADIRLRQMGTNAVLFAGGRRVVQMARLLAVQTEMNEWSFCGAPMASVAVLSEVCLDGALIMERRHRCAAQPK